MEKNGYLKYEIYILSTYVKIMFKVFKISYSKPFKFCNLRIPVKSYAHLNFKLRKTGQSLITHKNFTSETNFVSLSGLLELTLVILSHIIKSLLAIDNMAKYSFEKVTLCLTSNL
jgi:hypothetical protein